MVDDLVNIVSLGYVSIQHAPDEINTFIADGVRYPQITIHYLVDTVKWVLLVDDRIQQDSQCPDILLFATIGSARKDFRGCIICVELLARNDMILKAPIRRTNCANKHVKRPIFYVCSTSEVDQLDITFAIENHVFVFDISVDNFCFCM